MSAHGPECLCTACILAYPPPDPDPLQRAEDEDLAAVDFFDGASNEQ